MRTSHQPGIISGRWRLWEQTEGVLCLSETSFYRCMGSKTCRNSEYSGKTDTSKGRNPDCFEALSGKIVLHFYKKSQRHEKKVEK